MRNNVMDIMTQMAEVETLQQRIIEIQRSAINSYHSLLCQYISMEEVESTEAYRQTNKAAALEEALGRKEV